MQISDTKLQLQLASTPSKLLQSLRPGQLLRAITITATQGGTVQLQIGKSELTAQTNIALQAGEKLTLSVVKGGDLPQLQIITQLTAKQLLQQATMSALPRQQPLQPLFRNLTSLLVSGDPLPPPLKELAGNFMRSIQASSDPAFSQRLREAITRSGPFLESQLAAGNPVKLDLKATLIQMIQMLRPLLEQSGQMQNGRLTTPQSTATGSTPLLAGQITSARSALPGELLTQLSQAAHKGTLPATDTLLRAIGNQPPLNPAMSNAETTPQPNPLLRQLVELFRNIEGALARVQLHQVAMLQGEEGVKNVWQLELPIRHGEQTDSFEMRIEQQISGQSKEASHTWTLTLHFDIEPLGPLHTHLTLHDGKQLSTIFWAEQSQTINLLQDNLPLLRSNLEKAGLKVARIDAYQGKPPQTAQPTWQTSLLDEKA